MHALRASSLALLVALVIAAGCGPMGTASVGPIQILQDPPPDPQHWVYRLPGDPPVVNESAWAFTWQSGAWNGFARLTVYCPPTGQSGRAAHDLFATFYGRGSPATFANGDSLVGDLVFCQLESGDSTGAPTKVAVPDSIATSTTGTFRVVYADSDLALHGTATLTIAGPCGAQTVQMPIVLRRE